MTTPLFTTPQMFTEKIIPLAVAEKSLRKVTGDVEDRGAGRNSSFIF